MAEQFNALLPALDDGPHDERTSWGCLKDGAVVACAEPEGVHEVHRHEDEGILGVASEHATKNGDVKFAGMLNMTLKKAPKLAPNHVRVLAVETLHASMKSALGNE